MIARFGHFFNAKYIDYSSKNARLITGTIACVVFAFLLLATSYFLLPAGEAYAAPGINEQINFQGRLLNSNGTTVTDGSHSVVFSLYTVSSAGSNIWTETQSVTTTKGLFRVSLGSVSSLSAVNFNQDTLYLGIKVGTDTEMTPRLRFNAAPYAFMAETATLALNSNTVDGLTFASGKTLTVNNSLTLSGTDSSSIDFGTGGTVCYVGACAGATVADDSLDFDKFADAMTLDANTSIALGAYNLSTTGTGGLTFGHTGDTTFAGEVGIGTTDPQALLQVTGVNGDTRFESGNILNFTRANANYLMASSALGSFEFIIGNTVSGATRKAGIFSNGFFGVGDFNPDALIEVSASAGASDMLMLSSNDDLDGDLFVVKNSGNVGIGLALPNNQFEVRDTAEQLRLSYDASNRLSVTVNSTGGTTLDATGSGAGFTFADATTFSNGLTLSAGTLSLPNNAVTDAMVADTLTSSIFIGSGSSTNAVDLGTAEVGGTLGVGNGGTGQTTAQAAINSLSGLTTEGDLLYHNGTNATRLARGSDGQCLTSSTTTIVWASCGNLFTDGGTFSYLTSTTDDFILGASSVASAALHMDVSSGYLSLGTDGSLNGGLTFYSTTAGVSASIFTDASGNLNLAPDSGGTVVVGGAGGNIELSLSNASDLFKADKTVGSLSGALSSTDFEFKRNITGGANAMTGKILSILDTSSGSATIAPDMLFINAAPSSGTFSGNLINAQVGGVSRFHVNANGAVTAGTYNGLTINSTTGTIALANSKTLTVSNSLTFQGVDSSTVSFGAGGTVCYTSSGCSVAADALDFDDFVDAMTLDAATSIALGGNTLSTTGTGSLALNHTSGTIFASNVGIGTASISASSLTIQGLNDSATLGAEKVGNTTFTTSTGWTFGTGWSHDATNGEADFAGGGTATLSYDAGEISGEVYLITYTIKNRTAGFVTASIAGVSDSLQISNGTYQFSVHATSTANMTFTPSSTFNGSIDDVSVKKVSGSTAIMVFNSSDSSIALEIRVNDDAQNNLFTGKSAGEFVTTGSNNIGIGSNALQYGTQGNYNVALGNGALQYNGTNQYNIAIGHNALNQNRIGSFNTAIGNFALDSSTNGGFNTTLGHNGLTSNTTGSYNTTLGSNGLYSNTTGSNNIAIGYSAGYYNQTGTNNVFIGHEAGRGTSNHNKTGNVFIGYQAGYNETGSDLLYIENSNSATPLIKGDFANDTLTFNGSTIITSGLYVSGGLMRITNPQGSTTAPTRSNNGEFAFAQVSGTARLYAKINGTDVYFNSDGAGDYSEYFTKANYLEQFETGVITTLDSGKVQKAVQNSTIHGIVSAFGTRNNDDNVDGMRSSDPRYVNVGLLGQLPVIVSDENGHLSTGDHIGMPQTIAGVGVKATEGGVARALESFSPTYCTQVDTLANIVWPAEIRNQNAASGQCWLLPNGTKVGKVMAYIATTTVTTGVQTGAELNQQLNHLLSAFTINNGNITTDLNVIVYGRLHANGGLSVTGPAEFNGPAIFKAMAEFIDTVVFRKEVTFEDHVTFSNDTVGTIKIAKGQDKVQITFNKPYQAKPVISASIIDDKISASGLVAQIEANVCQYGDTLEQCQTKMQQNLLTNGARYLVTDIEPTGFTILLDSAAAQDYTFSWSAFATAAAEQ